MANRALIVGIANYGGRAPALEAPDTEIQEWRDLLIDTYHFEPQQIRLLANDRATKDELMARLRWLLNGASANDKRVFIYSGHGVQFPERNGQNQELLDHLDEALLTYPAPGEDLAKAAFYDKDLFKLYQEVGVANNGAKVTFIFDCCFAGGINLRDVPFEPTVMSVDPPVDLEHRRVGWEGKPGRWMNGDPVLVSAAGEINPAFVITVEGTRRSLFGYHAIRALRKAPHLTYYELRDRIRPEMAKFVAQYPNVRGNQQRLGYTFLN